MLALHRTEPEEEDVLLRRAVHHALSLTRSRIGFLLEIEGESRVVRRVFSEEAERRCAVGADLLTGKVPHEALWARCIRERKPVVVHRYLPPSGTGVTEGHLPVDRLLCVPIFDKGRVVMVCGVANKASRYDQTDAERLTSFAEAVWILLDRRRIESQSREQEAVFRALAEQAIVGVGLIGPEGFRYANRALENLAGYTLAQIQTLGPLGFAQCVHPEDRDLVLKRHVARMMGDPGLPDTYEFRLLRANGDVRWVTLSSVRLEISGTPAVAITAVDTHERHEAEEVRRQAFERVRNTLNATVMVVGRAVEVRDPYTAGHQGRVADLARAVAGEMGLPSDRVEAVRVAGLLHDVGKIGIPAEVLAKPGRLAPVEMELMRRHSRIGHDILGPVEFPWPIHRYVLQHHERLDGSGYPDGARGDEILLESRILAVADMVEAMASHRPYRPALGVPAALSVIESEAGKTLDPEVVAACLRLFREQGYQLG